MLKTFGEAILALKEGKKVKRQCWDGAYLEYLPETEERMAAIQVTLWNGRKVVGWNNTTEDLFADDWIVE